MLTMLGSVASYATTLAITGMGIIFFGTWAIAILRDDMR